ncbi:MAG: DMT family transporter, partial [Hallerella sp.]|nr:DMT family transporter [Hallerella sp.]
MLFFILTLGAAVCFAFGNVLAKSGVAKSGEKADIHHPIRFIVSFLTSKRWWTGFCLSALGNVGNYTAMALYNLSLVKPISALNPVLTAIFGRIFLKEPINRRVVAAIVCVLCGLLFASSEVGEAPGVQNIPALCIFVGILLAFAFASHFIFRSPEVGDSITMGTCYGLSDVLYKSLAIDATAKGIQLSADELLYWIADVRVWAFAAT